MFKLSPISPSDLIKILNSLDFTKTRQKGSHARFRHSDGRKTTVPIHKGKDIPVGTLSSILDDIKLSVEEFNKLK